MTSQTVNIENIYRRNFVLFLLDGILFTVAIGMMGSSTVIPDFVRRLTDSEVLIGLSSTLFSVGYTLPQLFVARYIVGYERKKWWFILPNIPTRFVILTFAIILGFSGTMQPTNILFLFLGCYAIAALGDGLVGVPWAEMTGSSLDERWRARFYGFMSAGGGLIMLAVTPLIALILGDTGPDFPDNYALLFGISGVLFVISIFPVIFVHELPGGKAAQSTPSMMSYLPKLGQLIKQDKSYRSVILAQVFTSLFLMAMPFYIGFSTTQLGLSSETAVPVLFAMQTIGNISGALIYTWLGAKNNLLYIRLSLIGAAFLPLTALLASTVGAIPLYFGFLLSGVAVSNLMFAYQNWILTHAPADERPIYIGLSNTIIAVVTMISPIIGGIIIEQGTYSILFLTALVMALGAFLAMNSLAKAPSSQESSRAG